MKTAKQQALLDLKKSGLAFNVEYDRLVRKTKLENPGFKFSKYRRA